MNLKQYAAQYPLVLWALALFFITLGFNFKLDVPLALLAMLTIYALGTRGKVTTSYVALVKRHWPVCLFLVVTALVTVLSRNMGHSLEVQPQLLPALLIYVVIVQFVTNRREYDFVVAALIISGVIIAAYLLIATTLYAEEDPLHAIWKMESPLFIAPNDVLMLSILAPLAVALFFVTDHAMIKTAAITYLLLALLCTIYMQSRQAVAIYLGSIFLFFVLMRPLWGVIATVAGLAVVLVLDIALGKNLLNKIFLFPRLYIWDTAWEMFIDRPIHGQGPGMFKELYYIYLEKSGYVFEQVKDRRPMNWAHSLYFEQLAERGLLGLLALLTLFAKALLDVWRYWHGSRENPEQKMLVAGLGSAIVALLMAGIAEASLLRLWVTVVLFTLLALVFSISSYKSKT